MKNVIVVLFAVLALAGCESFEKSEAVNAAPTFFTSKVCVPNKGLSWEALAVYYRFHTRVLHESWYGLDRTKVKGGTMLLCLYSRDPLRLVEAPLSVLER